MTKEQAIEYLKADIKHWENTSVSTDHLIMAIKVLEQQPSEDCVSRQAVLNTLFYKSDNNCEVVLNKELQDRIKALPPVTPTHKQGKWDKGYGFPDGAYWKCSCCNELIKVRYPMNYCPNCGASFKEEKRGNSDGSN